MVVSAILGIALGFMSHAFAIESNNDQNRLDQQIEYNNSDRLVASSRLGIDIGADIASEIELGIKKPSVEVPLRKSGQTKERFPRWNFGLALGAFHLPHYPTSDQASLKTLAFPYIIYRGEILRNDRGGLRGIFHNSDRVELNMSASAAFPASSAETSAREGMPNLDWTGEVGPQLLVRVHKSKVTPIDILLPYRFVFSTDFGSFKSRGTVFNPELRLRYRFQSTLDSVASLYMGPMWGSESINEYFFEVVPQYETAKRASFNARSGYMGFGTSLVYSFNWKDRIRMFSGITRDFYSGAKNRQSPLFRRVETDSIFLGFAISFYKIGLAAESGNNLGGGEG